jgi:hypothetical protein
MCPVPEGKGIKVASKPKYFCAKWRGVEKCSGTKPMRRGVEEAIVDAAEKKMG